MEKGLLLSFFLSFLPSLCYLQQALVILLFFSVLLTALALSLFVFLAVIRFELLSTLDSSTVNWRQEVCDPAAS